MIDQEISRLQQLSRQLGILGELDLDQLAEWLDETLEQAGHDDSAMRTLSELLEVDSTQVALSGQPSTSGTQRASFNEKRGRFAHCVNETSHVRQNILPQRRINPYWQRSQLTDEPPKLTDSFWKWRKSKMTIVYHEFRIW
ncbi:hypothetical protein ANCDUO_22270 [Ancylostoma duodenale]|uniref:Uncharacterized protein n=1 Tax=Ancylostoma duodenale TaxID=51022 RepID=A0A0C2CCS4_9BILA|nr:hypothetical protein ANCDUO_22270 [Ancylostoma duodenale]